MYYYVVDEKLPPPLPLFNKVTFDRKIYTYFYMAICEKKTENYALNFHRNFRVWKMSYQEMYLIPKWVTF